MRDYQPNTNRNPYFLQPTLYKIILWIIRDYDRQKEEYHECINGIGGIQHTNTPIGGSGEINKPTENKALKIATLSTNLKAIEQALILVPDEYRDAVLSNIKYYTPYPDIADRRTFSTYKRRFIYHVAKNLNFV